MTPARPPIEHDISYPPARGPVLLLTCMDSRLLDEVVAFMDHDGLTNRYDHVILAGAALGALGDGKTKRKHWRQTFFDHLAAAYELRRIKDVYIIEHRDCGAYRMFLGDKGDFNDDQQKEERQCHHKYAKALKKEIAKWCRKNDVKLNVKSFLMDLRGRVALLD